jgi:RNA polymerase sigma-70 factor (ECF subfamily)
MEAMHHPGLFEEGRRARLVRLCATISGDRQAAEDLAQETLLEAWRNSHKLRDREGTDRWLAAIARNVCLRAARRRARDAGPLTAVDEAVCDEPERDDLVDGLDRALALLPAGTRDALVQRYVDDAPHAEIASRLGISEDAVSMRLTRGKQMLRRVLAEEAGGAEGWRPTRVWCSQCGDRTLVARLEEAPGTVAFRCPGCDPDPAEPGVHLPLANPSFAALVATVVRPTAILSRLAAFTRRYYSGGMGRASCTRCGSQVVLRSYTRGGGGPGPHERGLFAECAACGEAVSSSLGAMALAQPSVQALRRQQRRIRSLPVRAVEVRGSPAYLVRYESVLGSAAAAVLFACDTLRVLPAA